MFAALSEIANQCDFHGSVSLDRFLLSAVFWCVLVFGLRRIGVSGADGFLPRLVAGAMGKIGFVADVFLAVEKELGEVSEVFGAAGGDAACGHELEELAEDVVDVGGGAEFSGDRFELPADFVLGKELLLFTRVNQAEQWVGVVTEHAALAPVGERELAEMGWIDGVSGTGLLGGIHFRGS